MKSLLISDLHSNEPALRAVMRRMRRKGFDRLICPGDFVGYGAQPNQVLDTMRLFRGRKLYVRGNHDRVAAGHEEGLMFNDAARYAALWTRDHLSGANRRFLETIPHGPVRLNGTAVCHGSPFDEDEYVFTLRHAQQVLLHTNAEIVVYGHTHLPVLYWIDEQGAMGGGPPEDEKVVSLQAGRRYLINPGSVGQPRDRNPSASCALLDDTRRTVQFFRVTYDVGAAQAAIMKAGLPRILADRLAVGA